MNKARIRSFKELSGGIRSIARENRLETKIVLVDNLKAWLWGNLQDKEYLSKIKQIMATHHLETDLAREIVLPEIKAPDKD